ncbi:Os04g0370200 [Oryza sativa Japonica Group]|uniref:Os04g0370200 protein n=1 Tax=Oryza sativa subsp. japonica TaxID=39947 RepID=A0A0N7KIX2_ORYSJ|nr:Os04g0370200 [Oryza sativa Japonica Group]
MLSSTASTFSALPHHPRRARPTAPTPSLEPSTSIAESPGDDDGGGGLVELRNLMLFSSEENHTSLRVAVVTPHAINLHGELSTAICTLLRQAILNMS